MEFLNGHCSGALLNATPRGVDRGGSVTLNDSLRIGALTLPNRLIQGPLAGFSAAPFRQLFYQFCPPAYCVSEMISANDVLYKHQDHSRYLYRAPEETILSYQISGSDPVIMAEAARRLEAIGADLIDLNCGCPKAKIRKKGAGSALLEKPLLLSSIVSAVRAAVSIPVSVKLRILGDSRDKALASCIEQAGADALIIHARRWDDDYDKPADMHHIRRIKESVRIPVIANGDIADKASLAKAMVLSGCDAFMMSRAGTGKPWLYQALLREDDVYSQIGSRDLIDIFLSHLQGLAALESEYQAVLQSKKLVRYYFALSDQQLQRFYALQGLGEIEKYLVGDMA